MNDVGEVTCRPRGTRGFRFFAGLGAAGAVLAALHAAFQGEFLDVWSGVGLLLALVGIAALQKVTARVSADAYGLHCRTLLRRRTVPWHDVADLHVRLTRGGGHRAQDVRRTILVLRDGRKRRLPLPQSRSSDDPDFDAKLDALRALHRRYGAPESSHLPVVSDETAGSGWVKALSVCVLLLACAGVAASVVPDVSSYARAWESAAPCTAETPATEREECLTTLPAVIARTEANPPKQSSWLYFADNRPVKRLNVSSETARDFQAGESVELTLWRGSVTKVTGEHHVWREHVVGTGDVAVAAAVFALAAGYPGALVLLRLRGRRLPDDEVLPSPLPFAGALVGTALWLLPLCYLHPTTLFSSPAAITWAAAGSLVTLVLFGWAWRTTRIRTPEAAGAGEGTAEIEGDEDAEVFLAARFLEHTDYNPHGFGTHIVLGGGPLAVTPHAGPGRYAAKRIPVERLTVKQVRRARGSDADIISDSWYIAEIDDAGTPVRLTAAPDDLARIVRALGSAKTPLRTTR